MANRNFANSRLYTGHVMPVLLDCNFVVDATNGNGLGLRNLKGPYVSAVYMHTSATPAAGNPNPASGVIVVQLQDSYSRYYGGFSGQVSPLSGTPLTATVANTAYAVVSLGTATAAQWIAAGIPASIVASGPNGLPAIGTAFIAAATATIGGSATVEASSATGSGIDHIEILGDPNASIGSTSNGVNQIILQCFSGGALTAPAAGSVISLSFYMSNSSVLIAGE